MRDNKGRFIKGYHPPTEFRKGHKGYWLGKKRLNTDGIFQKGHIVPQEWKENWSKKLKGRFIGEKNPAWKGGFSKTKEYKKYYRKIAKYKRNEIGRLTVDIIQMLYEDNIKKYGTLTCIYCLRPIEFGQDTIDHKLPISKGGTNIYENLAIACHPCNSRKHIKTYEEFKNVIK